MYPRSFHYHRANSLAEATTMLSQLGDDAKFLAGGQSLIPLMKLRFANPQHLVDLNFVPGTSYIKQEYGRLRLDPLTRHSEIEHSEKARLIPIVHDCAAGIADVQVRNRGTIGGSLAEADPSGDWATVLLTQKAELSCLGPKGTRTIPLQEFIKTPTRLLWSTTNWLRRSSSTSLRRGSGSAYMAFKRSAPVYPTASAAVQLTLADNICTDLSITLGCVGLVPIRARDSETTLRGQVIDDNAIATAAEAARESADPQADMRGSAEYKRTLVAALVKKTIRIALRRARGEQVETSHIYA